MLRRKRLLIRETPELPIDFHVIYKQPRVSIPIILYYNPLREVCICLRHGSEERYFTELKYAIDYAMRSGWLSDQTADAAITEAVKGIQMQEERCYSRFISDADFQRERKIIM